MRINRIIQLQTLLTSIRKKKSVPRKEDEGSTVTLQLINLFLYFEFRFLLRQNFSICTNSILFLKCLHFEIVLLVKHIKLL